MQTELETLLSHLVSIPSIRENSAACHEIIEFVHGYLEPFDLHIASDTSIENPWLIATTQDTKEPDIMLVAHIDVVPAELSDFVMVKKDDKLFGRGVYDMKFAAACFLTFIKHHIEEIRHLNIGLMFTTDEEGNSDCMPELMKAGWRPKVAFIPDGGYNWHIEERAKGLYGIEMVARGKTAHGSRPWEGDNALHRILDALEILRKKYPEERADASTLAVNRINAGTAINQIADYASAEIDFRSFSKEDIDECRQEIARLSIKYNFDVTVVQEGDPLIFQKTSPNVQSFLRALETVTGEEPKYSESFGGSDGRYFDKEGVPCILIQLMGGGHHSSGEWILASDLPRYYGLLETWILGKSSVL